jgi:NAD(P)-dependent dehydrogenase (short-subunit alcohol dehydrogenase family)
MSNVDLSERLLGGFNMDMGLSQRVALVTGASSGIGAAIAGALAAEGAQVAIGYHSGRDAAEQLAGRIEQQGGSALLVQHDLWDPASLRAAVDVVTRTLGSLDVLVTCAWVSPGWAPPTAEAEATPAEAWQQQLRANVEGTAYTVQAALPHMRARGWGRIVLISSGAAEDGSAGLEHYGTAKAALHGLSRSLARSAGPAGILTNVVMPGLIATQRHRQTIPAAVLDGVAAQTPTRRLATEDDVARVVVFLASAANCSVTGAELRVGGGMHM